MSRKSNKRREKKQKRGRTGKPRSQPNAERPVPASPAGQPFQLGSFFGPGATDSVAEARALAEQKRPAEAARILLALLDREPANAEANHLLGVLHHGAGRPAEGAQCIRRAIESSGGTPLYFCNLAVALTDVGHPDEAMNALRQAIELDPACADAHFGLGNLLRQDGNDREAVVHFRKCLETDPGHADAAYNLGNTLDQLGEWEEAIAAYETAIGAQENHLSALNNLITLLLSLNRRDEAEAYIRKAVRAAPESCRPYFHLAGFRTLEPEGKEAERIRTLLHSGQLPPKETVFAEFALGRILDHAGRYDEAFDHFESGNHLHRQSIQFDAGEAEAFMRCLAESFTGKLIRGKQEHGSDSRRPIFIVGMPRSGTTLLEQILCSHPSVHAGGELDAMDRVADRIAMHRDFIEAYPKCIGEVSPELIEVLAGQYLGRLEMFSADASRITDKMPKNLLHLGLIAILFPHAKVIHCRRNPLATCLSIYFQKFSQEQPFAYNLTEIGRVYAAYECLMNHWRTALPGGFLDFDHEALLDDQEAATRALLDFCELPWDARCLAFQESARPVRTASAPQVRKPIFHSLRERWKHYAHRLGPLKLALGMPPPTEE